MSFDWDPHTRGKVGQRNDDREIQEQYLQIKDGHLEEILPRSLERPNHDSATLSDPHAPEEEQGTSVI